MRRRWISVLFYTIQKSQFSYYPKESIQLGVWSSVRAIHRIIGSMIHFLWTSAALHLQHIYIDKRAIVSNMAVLGFYHKIVIRHHQLYPSVLVEQSKLEFLWTHCTVSSADHGQTHVLQISSWRTADICHYYPRANLVLFPSHLKCITTM